MDIKQSRGCETAAFCLGLQKKDRQQTGLFQLCKWILFY
jgi:hypothetical protein